MTISANDKTTFENIKSLSQIQPKDTLSIDYKVLPEGENLAKNISVEKAETMEATTSAAAAGVSVTPAAPATPEAAPATSPQQ
jgi:hypothetical protein